MSQSCLGDRCHFTPVSKVNFCSFPLAHVSTSVPILQDLTCCRGPSHWESQCGTLCLLNKERRKLRNATTQWCYKNRNTYSIKYRTEEKFVETDSGGHGGLALIVLLNISLSTLIISRSVYIHTELRLYSNRAVLTGLIDKRTVSDGETSISPCYFWTFHQLICYVTDQTFNQQTS